MPSARKILQELTDLILKLDELPYREAAEEGARQLARGIVKLQRAGRSLTSELPRGGTWFDAQLAPEHLTQFLYSPWEARFYSAGGYPLWRTSVPTARLWKVEVPPDLREYEVTDYVLRKLFGPKEATNIRRYYEQEELLDAEDLYAALEWEIADELRRRGFEGFLAFKRSLEGKKYPYQAFLTESSAALRAAEDQARLVKPRELKELAEKSPLRSKGKPFWVLLGLALGLLAPPWLKDFISPKEAY